MGDAIVVTEETQIACRFVTELPEEYRVPLSSVVRSRDEVLVHLPPWCSSWLLVLMAVDCGCRLCRQS
jgi:hypothetical protein